MQVTVYGAGYVGLVSAVCFADLGHDVRCVDIDQKKIDLLSGGQLPIYEIGLEERLQKNLIAGRITFSSDIKSAVGFGVVHIIAVGTPARDDGSVMMDHVFSVVDSIGRGIKKYCVILTKSTVPVGTAAHIRQQLFKLLKERNVSVEFDVVSNPEFLKEGAGVADFMNPDRIVIGAQTQRAVDVVRTLYASLISEKKPMVVMDERSAEFTKYVANGFLATKISFMNEMSRLSELLGVDIESVKKAVGLDKRIGAKFLNPGCGFGGSCFPKDVSALKNFSDQLNCELPMVESVLRTNQIQKRILYDKIHRYFDGNLQGKIIALWGLAFKPDTDDVRCAPSRTLMELLWEAGAKIQAHDPLAMNNIELIYGVSERLRLCETPEKALEKADGLAVVTEWSLYRNPDFLKIKQTLKTPVIFDGRNIYDPRYLKSLGIDYMGVGRVEACSATAIC